MASHSDTLAAWLTTEAALPAGRIDALVKILDANWIDDVDTLRRCYHGLEKHLPAAAHHAIGAALERTADGSAALTRTSTSRSSTDSITLTAPSDTFFAAPVKLLDGEQQRLRPVPELRAVLEAKCALEAKSALEQQLQCSSVAAFASPAMANEAGGAPNAEFVKQVKQYRKKLKRMYRCTIMPS